MPRLTIFALRCLTDIPGRLTLILKGNEVEGDLGDREVHARKSVMAQSCNPSTGKADTGGSLKPAGQLCLARFAELQVYREILCQQPGRE